MEKPKRPADEAQRLEALRRLKILDTAPEERFDRLARLAQSLLGVPTALVSLSDAERQWFKSRQGFDLNEIPRNVSFCGHAILGQEPFVVLDALKDPRFADNPLVASAPHIRFYAGVPLRLSTGEAMGTLCVMDRISRVFDPRRAGLLRDLGALVANEIEGATLEGALSSVREKEAKYATLLDETTDLILGADAEGRVLYANKSLLRALGCKSAQAPGTSLSGLLAPEFREHFAATVSRALKGADSGAFDTVFLSKSGGRVLARGRVSIQIEYGRPPHVRGVFQDITAQARAKKRASARLAATKARRRRTDKALRDLRTAADSSALVAVTDAAGRIASVNDRAAAISGYAREELVGKTHRIINSGVHPDGFFRQMWETIASGRTWRGEVCNRAKNGLVYWLDSTITPLPGEDGKPFQYMAISHDITGRKLAEARAAEAGARLQAVLDTAAQVSIIAVDLAGAITVFNKGAENLLGYACAEMLGKPPALLHFAAEGFEALTESASREWTYVRKDKSVFPVRLSVTALRGPKGEISGYLGVAVDISESRLAGDEVGKAREAAAGLAEAKTRFLSTMTREIRTPMNAIVGMAGLLLDASATPEQRELSETIRKAGESLMAIVGDIVDFSALEAGAAPLEEADFDPRAVAEDAAALFASAAQDKGLELATDFDESLPARLRGDAGRLRQIVGNLVGNAIKATEAGEVVIGARRLTEAGGAIRLRFEVKDTGLGLDPAAQARLFTAFAQADAGRASGSAGLGLAVSKKLVEMMGGSIGVTSAPGKGSTFWFEVGLEGATAPPAAAAPAEPPGAAGVRVLIVDDSEAARRIAAQQTASWRMRPHAVADGAAAMAAMRAAEAEGDPFILALIDLQMPAMDGAQLALEIKSDSALVAVRMILLGSPAALPGREELAGLGFDGALAKPARKSALHGAVRDALGARSSGRAPALKPSSVEPGAAGKGLRVLVADDNPVSRRMALFQLQALGCRADAVANGREASAAVAAVRYDLVLMDCRMPEMDGFEATAVIRARPAVEGRKLAIVGMAANALEEDRRRCLAAGMDDVLSSPVVLEDLTAALGRWSA